LNNNNNKIIKSVDGSVVALNGLGQTGRVREQIQAGMNNIVAPGRNTTPKKLRDKETAVGWVV
jgi:hypothetical protein